MIPNRYYLPITNYFIYLFFAIEIISNDCFVLDNVLTGFFEASRQSVKNDQKIKLYLLTVDKFLLSGSY